MTSDTVTIENRLTEMENDLIALAHCCNRDQQYNEAAKIQVMLTQIQTLDIQCADIAVWPPKINFNEHGDSVWEVVE
jgi:hypothetical protein